MEADKEGLAQKFRLCEASGAALRTAKAESDQLGDAARQDAGRARRALSEREKDLGDEKGVAREEIAKSRRLFDLEREELQATVGNLRKQKGAAEDHASTLSKDLNESKRSLIVAEDTARREARENLAALQTHIEKLEGENLRVEDARKRMEVEHRGTVTRVNREAEAARSDCQRIAREKEAMASRSAALADKSEALKQMVHEKQEAEAGAEKAVKDLRAASKRLEREAVELRTDNAELSRRIELSSDDVARLSAEMDKLREDNIVGVNGMKRTIEKDRQALKDKLKEEVSKYKAKLAKEVKRSEGYKEKALEAHQRGLRARNALSSVGAGNEMYGTNIGGGGGGVGGGGGGGGGSGGMAGTGKE